MITIKNGAELAQMRQACKITAAARALAGEMVRPGVSTKAIDRAVKEFILTQGAKPSFLNYHGFPASTCISVNGTVIHGIPGGYVLQEGDIVSVDCGTLLNGFCGDSCYTFAVGEIDDETKRLLEVTKESLYKGIEQAVHGRRLGDLGAAIQNHCEQNGFGVVREFVGHGIGRDMHESPEVPNYGRKGNGLQLRQGMCIAIEPMITLGKRQIFMERDGWTVRTRDRKNAAHFEHTVAVGKNGADILSSFDFVEEVLRNKGY